MNSLIFKLKLQSRYKYSKIIDLVKFNNRNISGCCWLLNCSHFAPCLPKETTFVICMDLIYLLLISNPYLGLRLHARAHGNA
ncbi:hypothetical protein GDO86_006230 [Hymenochirus boettgeri]|uniref:Uncharacterized protein n=1 Tax=Hymenochirus boettgeri TaxID=247094 RepID=A0A8T2J9J4_9PIPI|nr:hypothetical protein GDO86_006230 [Hymenochirus boettgeri]